MPAPPAHDAGEEAHLHEMIGRLWLRAITLEYQIAVLRSQAPTQEQQSHG